MKKILLISVISIFITSSVYAAQYENYEWGISKQEAIKQVEDNGYNIMINKSYEKDNEDLIAYKDNLFGDDIIVGLLFTPISKKLCGIVIKSDDTSVGRSLKPILEKKYGKPRKKNQFQDIYLWINHGNLTLRLEYDFKTEVIYYSPTFFIIFQQEEAKLNEQEAKDKF